MKLTVACILSIKPPVAWYSDSAQLTYCNIWRLNALPRLITPPLLNHLVRMTTVRGFNQQTF